MAAPAAAQELGLFGGATTLLATGERSYAWELEYRQPLTRDLEVTAAWINEGHLPGHSRDGYALRLWGGVPLGGRFRLALGAGVYRYFDTHASDEAEGYENGHGLAGALGVELSARLGGPWVARARATRLLVPVAGNDVLQLVVGLGYEPTPDVPSPASPARTTTTEVTAFFGRTVRNSFKGESSPAYALEIRQGLAKHLDVSAQLLSEGGATRRSGVMAQLWLTRAFARGRLALALGAGGYVSGLTREGARLSAVITPGIRWRLGGRWLARAAWTRVASDVDRDADVFLLGIGWRR